MICTAGNPYVRLIERIVNPPVSESGRIATRLKPLAATNGQLASRE